MHYSVGKIKNNFLFISIILGILGAGLLAFLAGRNVSADPPLQTCSPEQVRATQRYWFFGNQAGLDFGASGNAAPAAITGAASSSEGTTVVTDTSGALQFWSNASTVFNRNHVAMQNGTGLTGNVSATQTVAAFPSVSTPGTYFIVTTTASEGSSGQLRYSQVDMNLNGGLGAVTSTKNVDLGPAASSSEGLVAAPNADGTGYWVITFTYNSPNVLAYLFDGDGPADPDGAGPLNAGDPVISTMPSNNRNQYGALNFSADYTKLLLTTNQNTSGGATTVRLLDLDATNGEISQTLEWGLPTGTATGQRGYAADFSPSGDYVYAMKVFAAPSLLRYNIAGATTGADVEATLENFGNVLGNSGGQVKRGPDGRMYVAQQTMQFLGVVNNPDAASVAAADFNTNGVALAPRASLFGLPQTVTGCYVPTASVGGGRVFNDAYNNGVYDPAEDAPIPNVTMTLEGCSGGPNGVVETANIPMLGSVTCAGDDEFVTRTAMTDINGEYDFTQLFNGRYRITQTQPAGYTDGARIVGSAGGQANAVGTTPSVITNILIGLEDAATGYDFAEIRHELTVEKTSSESGPLVPNGTVEYTVTVENTGDVTVPSAVVTDEISGAIASATWVCTAQGGATCPNASGTGDINETVTDIPVGGSLEYVISATVVDEPPSLVANTATVTGADLYCMPANIPGPCSSTVTNPPVPIVGITKTVGQTDLMPGDQVTWQVTAQSINTNSPADGATITDAFPASVVDASWTCEAAGGAVCANDSGTGNINETIATFPGNSAVTFSVTATVASDAASGELVNTADVMQAEGVCLPDFTPAPCDASVAATILEVPPEPPTPPINPINPDQPGGDTGEGSGQAGDLADTGMHQGAFITVGAILLGIGTFLLRRKLLVLQK